MAKIFLEPGNRLILGKHHDPYRIIDIDKNGYALMLSSKVLDPVLFNNSDICTWETSILREYLNSKYWDEYFTTDQKKHIIQSKVINDSGNDTLDYVFALSKAEVEKYSLYISAPDYDDGSSRWLRSQYSDSCGKLFDTVRGRGEIDEGSPAASSHGVRPAFWLDLNSLVFDNVLINRFHDIAEKVNRETERVATIEFYYDEDDEEYWDG